MKNKLVYLLMVFALFSCKKENLLEDVVLAPNEYENSDNRYVTVKNVKQITCKVISFDIVIHTELLPKDISDNIDDYMVLLETPSGSKMTTSKYRDLRVVAMCDTLNEYKVSLYQKWPERFSEPYSFTFRTTN